MFAFRRNVQSQTIVWFVTLGSAILMALSVMLYQLATQHFLENFRKEKRDLAQSLARSIDGDLHQTFRDREALTSAEFLRYYRYMQEMFQQLEHVNYMYTAAYDSQTGQWAYIIDTTLIPHDTVWLETERFSFELTLDSEGRLAFHLDNGFSRLNTLDEGKVRLELRPEGEHEVVLLNGEPLLRVNRQEPLFAEIGDVRLDAQNDTLEITQSFEGQELLFSYSFSQKHGFSSIPGSVLLEKPEVLEKMREVLQNGEPYVDPKPLLTAYGLSLRAYGVIKNQAEQPVGLLLLEVNPSTLEDFKDQFSRITILGLLGALIILGVAGYGFARHFTQPILTLLGGMKQVAAGNLGVQVEVRRQDELGELAQGFNGMVSQLEQNYRQLEKLNQAYYRFVPYELLELLNKASIVDVELGDNIQKSMSVLFSDIRDFTTISESMTPEENFRFLNSYFRRMEPIIRHHNGFVDKYIGDAIMALFHGSPDDALQAALEMLKELQVYNQHRRNFNYPPLKIGMGINTGELMLGTVGGQERMEGTVISDTVNSASRIEALNKHYGTTLLISEHTYLNLKQPLRFQVRFLDRVQLKGKRRFLTIYEVFEADPEELRQAKQATLKTFEMAWTHYHHQEYLQAQGLFLQCLQSCPEDLAARRYLDLCEQMLQQRAS